MKIKREKVLFAIHRALHLKWRNFRIGEKSPAPPREVRNLALGFPRIIIPLEGMKRIRFASKGHVIEGEFNPGEALVCNADVWCEELWDTPHSMLSIVLRNGYLRVLTISYHNGGLQPNEEPDSFFFHTSAAPIPALFHTMSALLVENASLPATILLFKAFLILTEQMLENDSDRSSDLKNYTWECVQEFMDANFTSSLDRNKIAAAIKIHPAHLSRLMRTKTGRGVVEYLTELRLDYAIRLLTNQRMSIKEIAISCGFTSESYFIRVFRKRFLVSPGYYRSYLTHFTHETMK